MWTLLAIILVSLILRLAIQWRRQWKIRHWRKSLALSKHEAIYQQLYAEVDGFALSQVARAGNDAIEYVYGEISFEPFIALLSLCHPDCSTVFYDLGSGTGKAVLASMMVFDVQKSCGIELFSSLCDCAKNQQLRLGQIPAYKAKAERIEFRQENILDAQFRDATLVFINATAFFGQLWQAISKQVEQIKPGSLVISTSKALNSTAFITLAVKEVAMSWGLVRAFIQQRVETKDIK